MPDDPENVPEHRHELDLDRVLDAVAPRLRALRTRRGLTLAELSEHGDGSVE